MIEDSELLAILADERKRSVGFDHDDELANARELALNYFKGEMPDVPSLPNRSKAVSTDVADAIETILPDLVEIFAAGDDVAAFLPKGQEDEEAAQQETDYVNHVVFNENDGFMNLYTFFKDALQVKTGLLTWWWEDNDPEEESFEGKSILDLAAAAQDSEIVEAEEGEQPETVDFTVRRAVPGRLKIAPIPPEDFTVGEDTVRLPEATYCGWRARPRAQELIVEGIDPEIVARLPAYDSGRDDSTDDARDTAGEGDEEQTGGIGDLRRVEVVTHYIRLEEEGRLQLWRVRTGGAETILIDKEKADEINIAAITPYVVTHRFYGESIADRLIEIQRINTALTRIALDSGYFALNQRMEVAMTGSNEYTIGDLLRNEPNVPVRVQTPGTIKPISAGSLNFDVFGALEYFQTKAEQRTGIVRAAQGLTPDTLHETAKGALALLSQAQKRVRLIARIFAETGVKDLFLGVHATLRKHAEQAATVRLRNKWVDVAPTSWGQRNDMTIEVGLGASGREAELVAMREQLALTEKLVGLQGGANGPLVTMDNLYNLTKRFFEKTGAKSPELYVSDPKEQPPQPPQPDPEAAKARAQVQIEQMKAQAKAQTDAMNAQNSLVIEREKLAADVELRRIEAGERLKLAREEMMARIELNRQQAADELVLKQQEMQLEATLKARQAESQTVSGPQMGGEPG